LPGLRDGAIARGMVFAKLPATDRGPGHQPNVLLAFAPE